MNQTACQSHDMQQALPEKVDCPLCYGAVDTSTCTAQGHAICGACGLRFNAVDAAERRLRLEEERQRLKGAARRGNDNLQPEPPVHPLQQWLSGAPWELPRRTTWQQAVLWIRRHPWLTGSVALGAVGLLMFCLSLSYSLQRLTDLLEDTQLRNAQLQDQSQKLAQSHAREMMLWQSERQQLQRQLDSLEREFSVAGARRTVQERSEREWGVHIAEEATAAAKAIPPQPPEHSLALMPRSENEPPLSPAVQLSYDIIANPENGAAELLGKVDALAISPDGRWLASGSPDGSVRLLELQNSLGKPSQITLASRASRVAAILFTPDSRRLIARGVDSVVRVWGLDPAEVDKQPACLTLQEPENCIAGMSVSGDGRWVLIGSNAPSSGEGVAQLWDLSAANPSEALLPSHGGGIQSVAVSHNGQWSAVSNQEGTVTLWSRGLRRSRTLFHRSPGKAAIAHTLLFSPNDRWLITASGGQDAIHLWGLSDAHLAATPVVLPGHTDAVRVLSIAASSRWLVSAGDREVHLWDLESSDIAESVATLAGHAAAVAAAEFSADGRLLVTADDDGVASLWSLSGVSPDKPRLRLQAGKSPITSLALARDGRWLATACSDGSARLWNLSTEDTAKSSLDRAGPAFSSLPQVNDLR